MTDLVPREGDEATRHDRELPVTAHPTAIAAASRSFFGRLRRQNWRNQAPTEFELGRLLTELDSDWTVLSAADVFGDLDTDFIVVGPPGVFLITTRVRADAKVWVDEDILYINGHPTNLVRDVRAAADRASARLGTAVGETVRAIPVLALTHPQSLSFGGDPARRVVTLPAELVTQWLTECSRTYSRDTVSFFAMIAEDRATWGSLPSDSGHLDRVR